MRIVLSKLQDFHKDEFIFLNYVLIVLLVVTNVPYQGKMLTKEGNVWEICGNCCSIFSSVF